MINFCTHFDRNYLDKGIALCKSLARFAPRDILYVLALDTVSFEMLSKMKLPNVRLFVVGDPQMLLSKGLAKARDNRTWQEFVWTLTPFVASNFMYKYTLEDLIYLDADSYFFSDPMQVIQESRQADIAIIPHRFPLDADKSQNGIYNVNWVYFKNTPRTAQCLGEWQAQCLDWCYARAENGRFADQKYLDAWPQEYRAHVIQHLGANLAPWNQMQYHYSEGDPEKRGGKLYIADLDKETGRVKRIDPLVFYHFHEAVLNDKGFERMSNYPLTESVVRHCYLPYEQEVVAIRKELKRVQ